MLWAEPKARGPRNPGMNSGVGDVRKRGLHRSGVSGTRANFFSSDEMARSAGRRTKRSWFGQIYRAAQDFFFVGGKITGFSPVRSA